MTRTGAVVFGLAFVNAGEQGLVNWFTRFRDQHIGPWQAGEIDDRELERAQVTRARTIVGVVFAVLIPLVALLVVAGNLSDHTPIRAEQMLLVTGFLAVAGVAVAFRAGQFAKVGARNMILARNRARAEANPAQGLPTAARGGAAPATAPRYFGVYKRSISYACTVIGLAGVVLVISGAIAYWNDSNGYEISPVIMMLAAAGAGLVLWGLYMIVDRRTFLELSAAGIWCRAWGKERHSFGDFKAVYARQNATKRGVVFVPRNPEAFRSKLSWSARLTFRGGGGVRAHARTMTLWTTEVDLPRDAVMHEVQAEVVRAARR